MKFIIAHEYYIIHMLQFIPLNNRSFRWKFNNSGETLDVGKERHHHNGSTSVLQYTPVTDQVSIHFIWCFPLFSRLYSSLFLQRLYLFALLDVYLIWYYFLWKLPIFVCIVNVYIFHVTHFFAYLISHRKRLFTHFNANVCHWTFSTIYVRIF